MAVTRKRPSRTAKRRTTARPRPKPVAKATSTRPASSLPAPARVARPMTTAPSGATRGKYVYCIIRSPQPLKFGPIGIGTEPAEVHSVSFKEIAAVVSDTPVEVFDATRENVLAHERVNETVMRTHTVIPMSFGSVFKTEGDIVELLRAAYDAFVDVLNKMEGKLEFGLKVLWDRD